MKSLILLLALSLSSLVGYSGSHVNLSKRKIDDIVHNRFHNMKSYILVVKMDSLQKINGYYSDGKLVMIEHSFIDFDMNVDQYYIVADNGDLVSFVVEESMNNGGFSRFETKIFSNTKFGFFENNIEYHLDAIESDEIINDINKSFMEYKSLFK